MPRILVVDDSKLGRRIAADTLSDAGYEIHERADGAEGLAAFRELRPDCLVTDLLMPRMNGVELVREIRTFDTTTPIVVASADIQQSARDECESFGIQGFLNKPLKRPQLLECVQAALDAAKEVIV